MAIYSIKGACDLHIHSAPDIFERLVTGMAPKEIGEELRISRSTLYDDIEKIRKTVKKHMNP